MSLPPDVVARCAATDPVTYSAHGATATGLRWPDGWYENEAGEVVRVDSYTRSLIELEEDMDHAYRTWRADQVKRAQQARWDRVRQVAAHLAKEGL